jgi:hypothetical protein
LNLTNWPTQEDIDLLVDLTDVLFVFAATVVRFVSTPRHSPRTRLDILLARRESKFATPYHLLDQLYIQVLRNSVSSDKHEDTEELCERLRAVVGSIVTAQQPLTVAAHVILLDLDLVEVQLTVEYLSALLISTSNEPVRIFHPSFPDFIVNPRRCDDPRFLVSREEHHLRLARGCLALLNKNLRYNMANLSDPDVANSEVEDLNGRVWRCISHQNDDNGSSLPQTLFYAARYWTIHIVASSTTDSEELLGSLDRFCHDHLFHWLELLSIIQSVAYSTQSNLLAVIRWLEVRNPSRSLFPADQLSHQRSVDDARVSKISDLLRDTVRVLQNYAEPIRSHALHTFHSAYKRRLEPVAINTFHTYRCYTHTY